MSHANAKQHSVAMTHAQRDLAFPADSERKDAVKMTSLLEPNVLSFGFAVILSINTTSVWGQRFPVLPARRPNDALGCGLLSRPALIHTCNLSCMHADHLEKTPLYRAHEHSHPPPVPLSVGSLLLVGAMYVHELLRFSSYWQPSS